MINQGVDVAIEITMVSFARGINRLNARFHRRQALEYAEYAARYDAAGLDWAAKNLRECAILHVDRAMAATRDRIAAPHLAAIWRIDARKVSR